MSYRVHVIWCTGFVYIQIHVAMKTRVEAIATRNKKLLDATGNVRLVISLAPIPGDARHLYPVPQFIGFQWKRRTHPETCHENLCFVVYMVIFFPDILARLARACRVIPVQRGNPSTASKQCWPTSCLNHHYQDPSGILSRWLISVPIHCAE